MRNRPNYYYYYYYHTFIMRNLQPAAQMRRTIYNKKKLPCKSTIHMNEEIAWTTITKNT